MSIHIEFELKSQVKDILKVQIHLSLSLSLSLYIYIYINIAMMCMLVCKMVWVTGFTDNLILGQAIIYKYIVYKIINFDIYIYIYIK